MVVTTEIPIQEGCRLYSIESAYTVICRVCQKAFLTRRPTGRVCSYRCTNIAKIASRKHRRELARNKTCGHCKASFIAKRSDSQFCRPACRQAAHRMLRITVPPIMTEPAPVTKTALLPIGSSVTDNGSPDICRTHNRNTNPICGHCGLCGPRTPY